MTNKPEKEAEQMTLAPTFLLVTYRTTGTPEPAIETWTVPNAALAVDEHGGYFIETVTETHRTPVTVVGFQNGEALVTGERIEAGDGVRVMVLPA